MAGYLDQYGVGEERRAHVVRTVALAAVAVLVLGGGLWWYFQTYSQEREVKRFFAELASRNYQAAYLLWGCSEAKPCQEYPMKDFMGDWGPQAIPQAGAAKISSAEACGSGVIVKAAAGGDPMKSLWVESSNATIGFSPVETCPNRSPMKIMLTSLRNHLR